MLSLLRYHLKIVAPTLGWTGLLVGLLVGLVLFGQFRTPGDFDGERAASLAEQLLPLIAAFLSAGVLDVEMRRGAHELLRSRRTPLWKTVSWRLGVSLVVALLLGAGVLLVLHLGLRRIPLGMLLLAGFPSALVVAVLSLWARIRFGNAFLGYVVALGVWLADTLTAAMTSVLGVPINPLFTLTSFTDRERAAAAGALETTPYVDWWWINKFVLLLVAAAIFLAITRRLETLVEGD